MIVAKRTNDWLELLQLPDFNWWQFLFAAACLVVLIWSIVRFFSRVYEDVDPAESDQDMLNAISELRREGDLTEDEYRSIKSQLMGRMGSGFPIRLRVAQPNPMVGKPIAIPPASLSQNPFSEEEKPEVSGSKESESIQSTSASSLTEVPVPLDDTANKTAGSVVPKAENGEGI
ncbi:MAG: hypothetical protein WKF77_25015 [Planctomycetaceae bacterium]